MRYVTVAVIALALVAVFIFTTPEFDESRWYKLDDAKKISEETGKEIFIFVSSKVCPSCIEFKRKFSEDLMDRIEKKYVPVFLEFPRDPIPFKFSSFPTFCLGKDEFRCFTVRSMDELIAKLGV